MDSLYHLHCQSMKSFCKNKTPATFPWQSSQRSIQFSFFAFESIELYYSSLKTISKSGILNFDICCAKNLLDNHILSSP